MGNIKDAISNNLKFYRTRANVSQKALSEYLHVAPSTVSEWESGRYLPDADTLVKICDLLQISLDLIYGVVPKNEKAPTEAGEGKYADVIELLDKLSPVQLGEVRGYIKCLIAQNEAAEAAKQINGHTA